MKSEYLSELLFRHDCVIVPGLGGFLTSYVPARIDRETNRFYPPGCRIAFNASLSANDGLLANHIAKASGISYREATDDIHRWVDHLFHQLQSGEKLNLQDIGYIFLDSEGNLQFDPENRINYLGDSFGLPSFTAQPLSRKQFTSGPAIEPEIKRGSARFRHLIPETLKWAAVLAPFIAFTLWGVSHTEKFDNYFHNYSGLYSWVRSTPGKSGTVKPEPIKSVPAARISNPAAVLDSQNISLSPTAISYHSLRPSIDKKEVSETQPIAVTNPDREYFVICGAFKEQANAVNLVAELQTKGYPASIVDTTARGMYVVSIKGFTSRNEALAELPDIQSSGYEGAWVMHKH